MDKIEQISSSNEEILENFFKDMQHILYCKASVRSKAKMLYGARYRASYFLQINHHLLKEHVKKVSQRPVL